MKKITTIIMIIASVLKVSAQQDAMVSQYMFNGLFLNPAYAGSHKYITSTLLGRAQWVNFEGAPKTVILAVDGPIMDQKMGWGATVANDKIGVTSQTDVYANYSYFLKIGRKGKLGLGLKAGASQYRANLGDLIVWDANDPSFTGTIQSAWVGKFGFGTYYYAKKWYAGLSVPSLIAYYDNYDFNSAVEKISKIRKHYYLTSGYVFNAGKQFHIKPSFLLKYEPTAPLEADINLMVMYANQVSLGVSYRTQDAVVIVAEYHANRFRIGYAYDITTSKMARYSAGAHELMLGFDFGKEAVRSRAPRFF